MNRIRDNRGGALMLAVGYLAVMTLAASGFLAMLHVRLSVARELERMQQCRHLAEAGFEAALAAVAEDPDYAGEQHVPLGIGRYSVMITPHADHQLLIQAIGEIAYDGVVIEQRSLDVLVTLDPAGRVQAIEWDVEIGP